MVNIKMEELRFPRRRGALKPTKIQVVHGQNSHFTGKNLGRKAWMRGRSVIPQAGRIKESLLGIWYKKISVMPVVWVANREVPLGDSSGELMLSDRESLSFSIAPTTFFGFPKNSIWQSFDPGDTGMNCGINSVTGLDRGLTSWKSLDDPSRGNYTNQLA
ncbi:G-type lectin S-receptor-like serine/threonine-protein kinase At4g27290 [Carica papaya]|uniref:G-type lectin S-receptor-like serine/threonine-protein kinase At4g27290 n=1 Tax=Carica papaya TaxID=3649 RepID=UPI000B8CADEF|nr:G-type lectin S-receptor-like serine/threonine-protein kinase At4g27290 [Carica papaya]